MTPLNAILNVTDILQNTLEQDIQNQKFGDPNKVPASASSIETLPKILHEVAEDQKRFYEIARIIWSSAQILSLMITSQMNHTKLNMNQLMCHFQPQTKSMSQLILEFLPPFFH